MTTLPLLAKDNRLSVMAGRVMYRHKLSLAKARSERPGELSKLSVSITPPRPLTKTMLDDYAAIGVDRVIPMLGFYSGEEVLSALDGLANEVL